MMFLYPVGVGGTTGGQPTGVPGELVLAVLVYKNVVGKGSGWGLRIRPAPASGKWNVEGNSVDSQHENPFCPKYLQHLDW